MRFLLPAAVLFLGACDYAPAEKVRELSKDVETVKNEQRVMRTQVESNVASTRVLQSSVAAMGSGFNVLSDSVSDQEVRVEKLEVRTNALRQAVARGGSGGYGASPARKEPNRIGLYVGTRTDTRTLEETGVRVQWCEAEEGINGYLVAQGTEPNYTTLQCWRFGSTAIFRNETSGGVQVQCLRDVTVDEDGGYMRALDCDEGAVVYRFALR